VSISALVLKMKKWIISIFLLIAGSCLLIFRLSPHGGIVPFWTDTQRLPKYSEDDGTSISTAVVITEGSLSLAKNYEIDWLWTHNVSGVTFGNFNSKRIITNGVTFDVVPVEARSFYFNISKLRTASGPDN
jgi:hypothetical protein